MKWLQLTGLALAVSLAACAAGADAGPDAEAPDVTTDDTVPTAVGAVPAELEAHCDEQVGAPTVEEVAPDVFVARGYDLANTIVVRTADGNVVVDVGISPARAAATREALDAVVPGPVRAIVYTHSHIDHTGGASVWAEEGTQIWATDVLFGELLRQYGSLRPAESARAALQFGEHVPQSDLPCSALGRRADVAAALSTGVRRPTHTFSGEASFQVGGVTFQLVEAHGETADQLFVYLPHVEALLPGDNFYAAFPNLYTIRGSRPRPIDGSIASLDAMRARDPALLVPSHTGPVVGRDAVRAALTDYRDAVQWLRDEVTRAANALEPLDALVARIRLPDHLASSPYLGELYGQVDWSVRAIYTSELGWFDARTHALYPADDAQAREVALMGGPDAVLAAARAAQADGDARFASHLLGKLLDAGLATRADLAPDLAAAWRAIAATVPNTNGRGWLLEAALALEAPPHAEPPVTLDEAFVADLPASLFFEVMPSRVKVEATRDVHETLRIDMSDTGESWHLTVRRGLLEVVLGAPLPGTPAPVTVVTTDAQTWVRLALGLLDPAEAVLGGLLTADDLAAAVRFLGYFDAGL